MGTVRETVTAHNFRNPGATTAKPKWWYEKVKRPLQIGSLMWWYETPYDGARGKADTILKLLEQGEITRAKARELLQFAHDAPLHLCGMEACRRKQEQMLPSAPWGRLDWNAWNA